MLVFDGEIIKAILGKKEVPIEGIEYCNGWGDFEGMGISVIAVCDYKEAKYRVFLEDNLAELQKLIDERDFVIGFNNKNFDNKLLAAHGINIPEEKSFDLLVAIEEVTGTKKGLGLGPIAEANFTTSKNGDGAFAPILWQQKQYGKVIDYCLNDVKMTLNVLNKILEDGWIVDPRNKDNKIYIELPIDILDRYDAILASQVEE